MITVRDYTSEDVPAAAEIWNTVVEEGNAFPQENTMSLEEADNFFKSQTYTGIAYDTDTGEIVGLYILHPNNVGRCGHIANASYAVKKDRRGRRIGEILVTDCLKKAAVFGFRVLQFNAVVITNEAAIALYDKLGFTRLGRVPGGYRNKDGNYVDILLYYRNLVN